MQIRTNQWFARNLFFDKHDQFSCSYASVRHLWESVFLVVIKDLSTIGVDKKAGKHT